MINQFFSNSLKVTFLAKNEVETAVMFEVISSPPPNKITISPIGKTLAPMSTQAPAKSGGLNLGGTANVIPSPLAGAEVFLF